MVIDRVRKLQNQVEMKLTEMAVAQPLLEVHVLVAPQNVGLSLGHPLEARLLAADLVDTTTT